MSNVSLCCQQCVSGVGCVCVCVLSDLEPVWHVGAVFVHWGALVSWLDCTTGEWQTGCDFLLQVHLKKKQHLHDHPSNQR